MQKVKSKKSKNSFDVVVEMFKKYGVDSIYLDNYEPKWGIVTGTPLNSKSGEWWVGMAMVSSIEEAMACKYQKVCSEDDKELVKYLETKNNHDTK